jgi:hypothetical protein
MNTLICTAIVWALFFGIHFIFGADSDGFWGAFVMLGILGPIYVAFTSVRTSVRKTTLSDQGVDTGQYIPMFVHHSGLPKLADKQGTYVAALKSKDELVFFY